MNGAHVMLVVQLVLAVALMWSCFCRLVKTDEDTYPEVRWAILFEFAAAGIVLGAPFMPLLMPADAPWPAWSTPRWAWVVLLASITVMQIVTSAYWDHNAPPERFQMAKPLHVKPAGFRSTAGGPGLALIALAAGALLAGPMLLARPAQAQAKSDAGDDVRQVHVLQNGEAALCSFKDGCVAMTAGAFKALMVMANEARDCRARSST
jgi:hypothetical protein